VDEAQQDCSVFAFLGNNLSYTETFDHVKTELRYNCEREFHVLEQLEYRLALFWAARVLSITSRVAVRGVNVRRFWNVSGAFGHRHTPPHLRVQRRLVFAQRIDGWDGTTSRRSISGRRARRTISVQPGYMFSDSIGSVCPDADGCGGDRDVRPAYVSPR
jgi:hypothetical protein